MIIFGPYLVLYYNSILFYTIKVVNYIGELESAATYCNVEIQYREAVESFLYIKPVNI